jgi:hypothetical protein
VILAGAASNRSVSSPGFQIMRSSPASPNTSRRRRRGQRVVAVTAEQEVEAALAEQRVVAGFRRKIWSLPTARNA